jgi:L-ascorbate metabolism protein UlaG (beta-lactamase superfamily)
MTGRLFVGLPLVLAGGLLVVHAGWFDGEQPWEEATGWSSIPADLRPEPAMVWPAAAGEIPSIGWLGHSGFLIEWGGRRILLDPNTSDHVLVVRRVLERSITADALGPVDGVLISHAHFDHLDLPTLEAIQRIGTLVVPRGAEPYVAGLTVPARVVGLDPGEHLAIGDLEIVAVPAVHGGNRFHPLASRQQAVGYIIRHGPAAIYFAGDTGFLNDFIGIGATYHPLVAILPIGGYAPAWPIGRVHLSPEQAMAAADQLGASVVIPCHFGTFPLALDRPATALPRFARAAHEHHVRWVMPRLLQPREALRSERTRERQAGR